MNPETIWNEKQDHPELIIQDAREFLGLNEYGLEILRMILLRRGVNKWMYARWRFIELKHQVKDMLKREIPGTPRYRLIQFIYVPMQHIAKMSRWVEWGRYIHQKMGDNISDCVVRGRSL